jgi:hypothetical protein
MFWALQFINDGVVRVLERRDDALALHWQSFVLWRLKLNGENDGVQKQRDKECHVCACDQHWLRLNDLTAVLCAPTAHYFRQLLNGFLRFNPPRKLFCTSRTNDRVVNWLTC